jgi:hypothetical protein
MARGEYEKCADCGKLVAGARVSISADAYAELKRKADAFEQSRERFNTYRLRTRSPISRDPALADFILASYQRMTVPEIVVACRERFGSAPSRSAIDRFLKAVR